MDGKKKSSLLIDYLTEQMVTKEQLIMWQREAVQGQNGKEIFVIDNLKKRGVITIYLSIYMSIYIYHI